MAPLVAHDGAGDVGRVEDEFERFEDGFLAEGVVRSEELVGADVVPCYVVLFQKVKAECRRGRRGIVSFSRRF